MSRRYPDVGECDTCGGQVAWRGDEQRPHVCWVQWNGEKVPWARQGNNNAAKCLGVSVEFLHGLMNQGVALRGAKVVRLTDVGQPDAPSRYVFNREDVRALQDRLRP